MRVLVFDIWGEFGHFKKFYTTSSPLTFSVPPPTAIYGMLGAILGFAKSEYLKHINHETTKVAITLQNPIKKTRITQNFIDTKNSHSFHLIKTRTQIKMELLKDPSYRLYINLKDNILFDRLIKKIKNKETHYTLSLGLANLLANFCYVGVYEANPLEIANEVMSAILAENIKDLDVEGGKSYFKEKLPIDMTPNREVLSYKDVVFEMKGRNLKGAFQNCYMVGDTIISFL
ncbi:CRISPR-associated protein Cas5h [Nitratiruptor sp. YY08-26]|uniref:type I-B CRISPR-associated protein Cas5b n=1 Tax=unclassified Nitratiruptor TaxID=2624044 RepID=UPI00191584D8|nr:MULTISPECIES: type I-B CRISPR-associated protein Cas5b [unclassified Nitratiruptor]BCD61376.1 CRISPR-associated protein Cas5h [Nitratiruptor sp. YY08-13]BCD65310.1 CRISPR-associated protein Cas5h [Nitratiruptor sp. YY08-26]